MQKRKRLRIAQNGRNLKVPKQILAELGLFMTHTELLERSKYEVQSNVSHDSVRMFVHSILGEEVTVDETNAQELKCLCDEFGYFGLNDKLSKIDPERYVKVPSEISSLIKQFYIDRSKVDENEMVLADLRASVEKMESDINDVFLNFQKMFSDTEKEIARLNQEYEKLNGEFSETSEHLGSFEQEVCDVHISDLEEQIRELRSISEAFKKSIEGMEKKMMVIEGTIRGNYFELSSKIEGLRKYMQEQLDLNLENSKSEH